MYLVSHLRYSRSRRSSGDCLARVRMTVSAVLGAPVLVSEMMGSARPPLLLGPKSHLATCCGLRRLISPQDSRSLASTRSLFLIVVLSLFLYLSGSIHTPPTWIGTIALDAGIISLLNTRAMRGSPFI